MTTTIQACSNKEKVGGVENQLVHVLYVGHLFRNDRDFKENKAYRMIEELGYPPVYDGEDYVHVIPEDDCEMMEKKIVEWNVQYKVNLSAFTYQIHTSDLLPVN